MTMGRTCRTRGLGLTGPRAALAPRHGCGRAPTASTASARVRYPNDTLAETGFNPRAGARLWHQDLGRPVHEEGARCGLPTVLELAHLHGQHEVARGIDVALAAARHRVRRVVAMESPIPRAAVSADRPVLLRRWETCVLRGDRRHAVGRLHRLDELVEGVFRWLLPLLALDIADPPAEYWPHRGDAFALAVEFVTAPRRRLLKLQGGSSRTARQQPRTSTSATASSSWAASRTPAATASSGRTSSASGA